MISFHSPYSVDHQSFSGDDKNVCRAPATIGVEDYNFIRSIRPISGTVNTTQTILWKRLCDALKLAGITDVSSQRDFEEFVVNLQITDGREKAKLRSAVRKSLAKTIKP